MAWRLAIGSTTMVWGQFPSFAPMYDMGIPQPIYDMQIPQPIPQPMPVDWGMGVPQPVMDFGMPAVGVPLGFPQPFQGRVINVEDPYERFNPYSLDHSAEAVCCIPGEECDSQTSHAFDVGEALSDADKQMVQRAFNQALTALQFVAEKLSYETHRSQHYLDVFNGIFRPAFGGAGAYKIENLQESVLRHLIGAIELMRAKPSKVGYTRAHAECCNVGMAFNAVAGAVGKEEDAGWHVFLCPKFYRATDEWSFDNSKPAHILQQFFGHMISNEPMENAPKLMHAAVFKDFVTRILLSFPPPRQPLGILLTTEVQLPPAQDQVPAEPNPQELAPEQPQ